MKVLKIAEAILTFVLTFVVFYLIFAFIGWDIRWIENAHWFFRFLFLIISLPIAFSLSISMYDD